MNKNGQNNKTNYQNYLKNKKKEYLKKINNQNK